MSVYKHANGKHYTYDFEVRLPNGSPKRFRGPTGEATKREALKFEAKARAEAEAMLLGQPIIKVVRKTEIPLREAAGRYWNEKAQFEGNHKTVFGQLGRLVDRLGPDTLLSRITANELTKYQSDRRQDGVANRTINAEVPELLSRVYKRAKLWGVNLGEPVEWSALKLSVPKHRTRAASRLERVKLMRALRLDYRPIVRFALASGLRRSALLLRKSQVDFDAGVIEYAKKSRHTGDKGWIPITGEIEKILRNEWAKHDGEWVFTYLCKRSRQGRKKGLRYPVTSSGFREAMEEAVKAAGLPDWRLIHDLRHTAATETLRKSQNLKAVQGMLGHSDIAQTARYAHVLLDDVKKAMESR